MALISVEGFGICLRVANTGSKHAKTITAKTPTTRLREAVSRSMVNS
jgi:hypothetical protein